MAQCFPHATIINGKDSANRIAERQTCLNVLLRCSLSYAKLAKKRTQCNNLQKKVHKKSFFSIFTQAIIIRIIPSSATDQGKASTD